MKINDSKPYNVNFKSVIPVKIYQASGKNPKEINDIISELIKILERRSKTIGAFERNIIDVFNKNVPDYGYPTQRFKTGTLIRHTIFDGIIYLFTGKQAEEINKIGKQFGPAKGPNPTGDIKSIRKSYRNKISEFVNNQFYRLKKNSQPLELQINVNKDKKRFTIKEIKFESPFKKEVYVQDELPIKLPYSNYIW